MSIHQSNQNASKQIDKPSTSHGTMIDCDNPRYDSTVSNKPEFLRNLSRTRTFFGDEKNNAIRDPQNVKVYTWVHSLIPDNWIAENEIPIENRARPMNPIFDDNSTSDGTGKIYLGGITSRRSNLDRKRSADCPKRIDKNDTLSQINKKAKQICEEIEIDNSTSDRTGKVYLDGIASRRSNLDRKQSADCPKRIDKNDTLSQVNKKAKQICEVIEIDSAASKLKYSARLPPKKSEKIARSRSDIEKTVNQDNSSSSLSCDQIATSSSLSTTNTPAITEQLEKKLNISTEKKRKLPRIIEHIVLSPNSRFDPAKIAAIIRKNTRKTKDGREANISNRESNDGKENAIDKNLDLSNAKKILFNETNSSTKLYDKDKVDSSKSTYTDQKDVESPLLSKLPLSYRLSSGKHKEDDDNRKSVHLPISINDELAARLKVVKHDLNFPIRKDQQRTYRNTVSANKRIKNVHIYNTKSTDAITSTVPFRMSPLSQSTSIVAQNSIITTKRPEVFKESMKIERKENGSILLTKPVNTKTLENVRRQSDRRDLCFVCSGLTESQIASVKEFAAKYNANYVMQFNRGVTHVIVNTTGKQNAAKITLKYLQGIAHRKWIVSYKWIEDCNRQHKLLNEVPYEATTQNDSDLKGAGPRNSRLRERGLFKGFTFFCIGPYDKLSLAECQDLLLANEATVINSFEIFAKMRGMKGVVVQHNNYNDKIIEYWYQTANAVPILVKGIVQCIVHYKILPLSNYILRLSKDCYAISYP